MGRMIDNTIGDSETDWDRVVTRWFDESLAEAADKAKREWRARDNSIVILRLWSMGVTHGALDGALMSTYFWAAAFGPPSLEYLALPSEGVQLDGKPQQAVIEWTFLPVYQERDMITMSTWHLAATLSGNINTKG